MKKQDDVKDNESHELSKQMDRELSLTRSILRIIIGFFAMLIWILLGFDITIFFSSTIQQTMGWTSIFIKNPIFFLIVAFINIIFGLIAYGLGILWWAAIHLIWSIRWFYGFFKYNKINN
ncbi:MAG TPA: hypothetical protein PLC38_09205 [Methanobacterium sp.]|nr:hypothetical protein [Methanobacterium sp.]